MELAVDSLLDLHLLGDLVARTRVKERIQEAAGSNTGWVNLGILLITNNTLLYGHS